MSGWDLGLKGYGVLRKPFTKHELERAIAAMSGVDDPQRRSLGREMPP